MIDFNLTIRRGPSTDFGTFGKATLSDGARPDLTFDWLELPWRDNKPERSCIPIGSYRATLWDSPTFIRKVYRLNFVPGRTNILIHPANWAGDVDKGYHSDLEGCHAPGHGVGELQTPEGKMQRAILHSGVALDEIINFTGGGPISVRVVGFGQVGG